MESRDMFGNTTFNGYAGDDGNGNFSGTVEGKPEGGDKGKNKEKEKKGAGAWGLNMKQVQAQWSKVYDFSVDRESANYRNQIAEASQKAVFFQWEAFLSIFGGEFLGSLGNKFSLSKVLSFFGKSAVKEVEGGLIEGGFDAVSKTTAELRTMIGGENAARLRQLFGTNEKGAQAVLDNIENVKIPKGLAKETMQAYRELINRVPDPRGTQAIRAKILDNLLK